MDSADPDDKLVISSLLISISCRNEYTHDVTERCSRLFHQRLKTLMSNLFDCEKRLNLPRGMQLPVLDLGELPLADLENQFCLRVASQFEQHISAYLVPACPAITADGGTARNLPGSVHSTSPNDSSTTDTDAFQRFLHDVRWRR
jgi:Contractile injection system tape measure protein